MDPGTLLLGPQLPSMSQVLRSLKRQESSLWSCAASCCDDAAFVAHIANHLYASLPTYANLRCGLWYVERPRGPTCYFKSTDGHNGNWAFSVTRLNLHVAEAAAAAGGCVIVDATRRGKTFPDALTKTVPIWAAVLNRALARLRGQQRQQPQGQAGKADNSAGSGGSSGGSSGGEGPWDMDVHLPPWISANEAHQIRQRLDGWVEQLIEVGADLSPLLRTLRKPLRCIWISQESRIWAEGEVDTSGLPFSPLVLVSASMPNARERRQLTLPPEGGQPALTVVYDYMPGAGDDEESWGRGLTPELLWRHKRELLAAGREGIEGVVQRLLAAERGPPQARGGAVAVAGEGGLATVQGQHGDALPPKIKGKWREMGRAAPDQHHPLPQGCQPAAAAGAAAQGDGGNSSSSSGPGGGGSSSTGTGLHFLGDTGLAVGAAAAGAPPGVWSHVGAVLNVGLQEHPGMAGERAQQAQQPEAQAAAGPFAEPAAAGAAGGSKEEAGPADGAEPPTAGGQQGLEPSLAALPPHHYLWLPVAHYKFERQALRQALPQALEFVSAHLQAGRRVLVHCDDGLDTSVCVALAALLACFRLPRDAQGGGGAGPGPRASPQFAQPFSRDPAAGTPLPAAGREFGKLAVRRYLAALSGYYPQGRPSRGMLRQVYNLFVPGHEGGE